MRQRVPPAPIGGSRLAFLEGMRAIAALYVVFSHFCTMSDGRRAAGWSSHAPEWLQRVMSLFWQGNLAVAAFIVLSGFCLQLSLFGRSSGEIPDLRGYFRRRSRRILPAYYAALAASIAVALTVTRHQPNPPFTFYVPVTPENVLAHVFLVHNFVPDWMYKINGVLWSIAVEAQLYVLFPLLVLGFRYLGRTITFLVSASAAALLLQTIPNGPKLYFWYLPLFTCGMLASHFAYRPSLRHGTMPWLGRIVLGGATGGLISSVISGAPRMSQDCYAGVAVAALCYVLTTTRPSGVTRFLSWPPFVVIGGFSYSLYLIHHPIQQIVYVNRPDWVRDEATSLAYLFSVALPIILVVAYLFYRVFERPFMARRRVVTLDEFSASVPLNLPLRTYPAARASAD